MKFQILLFILLFLAGCELLTDQSSGETYDYPCAYQANKLVDESNQIANKMLDMGCSGIIDSDALFARCKELEADNKRIIREWNNLPCTDDSKSPVI